MPEPASANGHDVTASAIRPPRLPRWTRQEILVLIEGKRAVESHGRALGLIRSGLVGHSSPVEPKWASVSAYCRRHGVDRSPVQCRKRWSNLAGDFKKIKEWESSNNNESFWVMRNDLRRERRLPGFFDREVYDILDGKVVAAAAAVLVQEKEDEEEAAVGEKEEDGLFSDCEGEEELEEKEDEEVGPTASAVVALPAAEVEVVKPISEKKFEAPQQQQEYCSDSGLQKDKRPAENPVKGPSSSSQEGNKRRRTSQDGCEDSTTSLQNQLIEVLERNSRVLTAQLEAQHVNNQLDREQRKDQNEGLLSVLHKVADALGKIADKL